jgi:uncharacterized LabA/DUF88 family protein
VDRCALFVDAGYLLADGAMAVHGTRRRESVSWDHPGLLKLLQNLAEEQTGLRLLRCYWYEATVEGRRAPEHDSLADLPSLKLRLSRMRPGRHEGVDTEIHRDLTTLARNGAISDAVVVSADEDLGRVIADVQDLGLRVALLHVAVDGNWTISRSLRQECDGIIEIGGLHLQPYVDLIAGAEPVPYPGAEAGGALTNGHSPALGHATHPALTAGQHPGPPAIYTSPVLAQYRSGGGDTSQQVPARPAPASQPARAGPPGPPPAGRSAGAPPPGTDAGLADAARSQQAGAPGAVPQGRHTQRARSAPGPSNQPGRGYPGQPAQQNQQAPPDQRSGPVPEPQPYPAAAGPPLPAPTAPSHGQAQRPGWGPGYPSSPGPAPSGAPGGPYVPAQNAPYGGPDAAATQSASPTLADAVQAAHAEGHDFGESVARDAPALWLEAVLARKPRMPSDLEARLLQGSSLPIDFLLHDEVRHALRRGFWDALERARR